jgi:FkbM family methyltransferase
MIAGRDHPIGIQSCEGTGWVMNWGTLVRSAARRVGWKIEAPAPDLADFLVSRKITTVFDVGANIGQFGTALRKRGYRGRIISFEPIREIFEQLQASAKRDPLWTVHCCALGDHAGQATINVSSSSVFSSLLGQRHAASEHAADAVKLRAENIVVRTLDEFFAEFAAERCFLKIDTQGFERQVIGGAARAVDFLHGIQMELPVIHLYEDMWTLSQALDYMAGQGFVVSGVEPVSHHSRDRCAVIELDCIFRRRSDLD